MPQQCPYCLIVYTNAEFSNHACPAIGSCDRGVKHSSGKPLMSLIPPQGILRVAGIYTYGKKKYAAHNWRKGIPYSELLDATLRHIYAYLDGEDNDPESGHPHLAHACFGPLDILQYEAEERGAELDDRYKVPKPLKAES